LLPQVFSSRKRPGPYGRLLSRCPFLIFPVFPFFPFTQQISQNGFGRIQDILSVSRGLPSSQLFFFLLGVGLLDSFLSGEGHFYSLRGRVCFFFLFFPFFRDCSQNLSSDPPPTAAGLSSSRVSEFSFLTLFFFFSSVGPSPARNGCRWRSEIANFLLQVARCFTLFTSP